MYIDNVCSGYSNGCHVIPLLFYQDRFMYLLDSYRTSSLFYAEVEQLCYRYLKMVCVPNIFNVKSNTFNIQKIYYKLCSFEYYPCLSSRHRVFSRYSAIITSGTSTKQQRAITVTYYSELVTKTRKFTLKPL